MRRILSGLLIALVATSTSQAQLTQEELRRYGFSREYSRPGVGPVPGVGAEPGGDPFAPETIPQPRGTQLPSGGTQAPPSPPARAEPLVLKQIPGAGKLPLGAPLVPLEPTGSGPARYVGDTTCLGCHAEYGEDPERDHIGLSRQSASLPPERRGCEGCHGPGSEHFGDPRFIVNPATQEPREASRTCLDCHKMARLTDAHEWHFSRHASARLSCTDCHKIHQPLAQPLLVDQPDDLCIACHKPVARLFAMRSRHPVRATGTRALGSLRRGKVSCLDCHDPHGGPGDDDGMLVADLERTCARCHAGHTGPWVFPHVTPREGGGCMSCHLPHGSPNRNLLKSRRRTSCLQCHSDQVRHFPAQGCATTGCHVDVHGSNRSPFFFR